MQDQASMVVFLLVFFAAAAFSLILTPLIAGVGMRVGVVDHPSERKIHLVATPRVGGVSIAMALALALIFIVLQGGHLSDVILPDATLLAPFLIGAAIVFIVGLCDDVLGLSPVTKLLGQTAGAAVVIGAGILIDRVTIFGTVYTLGVLAPPVTLLWIIIITNAFNLVDGVDGLAGGLTCIAASTCAAVLFLRGDYPEALLLVAFVGAVAGFLPYNFAPAEVFLGDSGSLLCGFLLAVTAIAGRQKGATALAVVVPLLAFALPLLDTLFAVVRRLVGGQAAKGMTWWERLCALGHVVRADQGHLHHRLVALGLSPRRAVLVLYTLALLCSVLALMTMETG
jgi:UDP-GlcNAc:undecaprenyl-phosphate GlcNAc-1-phosphate transferase